MIWKQGQQLGGVWGAAAVSTSRPRSEPQVMRRTAALLPARAWSQAAGRHMPGSCSDLQTLLIKVL